MIHYVFITNELLLKINGLKSAGFLTTLNPENTHYEKNEFTTFCDVYEPYNVGSNNI